MGLPVFDISRDEIVRTLEQGAQARLGISAQAMIDRYHAGELEDAGAVADLLALAYLLPESDPLFAGVGSPV